MASTEQTMKAARDIRERMSSGSGQQYGYSTKVQQVIQQLTDDLNHIDRNLYEWKSDIDNRFNQFRAAVDRIRQTFNQFSAAPVQGTGATTSDPDVREAVKELAVVTESLAQQLQSTNK